MGGVGVGAEMWCPDRPLFCMSNFLIVPNLIKNKQVADSLKKNLKSLHRTGQTFHNDMQFPLCFIFVLVLTRQHQPLFPLKLCLNNRSLHSYGIACVTYKIPFYRFPVLKNHYWRDLEFDIFEKGVVGEKGVTAQQLQIWTKYLL